MSNLPLGRIEQIGLSAARAVAGDKVHGLRVRAGSDSSDDPAYYFVFLADRDQVTRVELGLDISAQIQDELVRNGDPSYPYVRLLAQDEWDRQ